MVSDCKEISTLKGLIKINERHVKNYQVLLTNIRHKRIQRPHTITTTNNDNTITTNNNDNTITTTNNDNNIINNNSN